MNGDYNLKKSIHEKSSEKIQHSGIHENVKGGKRAELMSGWNMTEWNRDKSQMRKMKMWSE